MPSDPTLSAMDIRVEKERRPVFWVSFFMVAIGLALVFFRYNPFSTISVDRKLMQFVTAEQSDFARLIPVRGTIEPRTSVVVTAPEGGRVAEIFVENGDVLEEGDLIARLVNTSLELDVISREAQVTEQRNSLTALELELQRNELSYESKKKERQFEISRLEGRLARRLPLLESGGVSSEMIDELRADIDYNRELIGVADTSRIADKDLQDRQKATMRESIARLDANLRLARQNLEGLSVRSFVAGRLSRFDLQVGQSLTPGEEIGQIDSVGNYKILAAVDEFYITDVLVGQRAIFTINGMDIETVVARISPQVTSGRFRMELKFEDVPPEGISRGQSITGRVLIDTEQKTITLPNGPYIDAIRKDGALVARGDATRFERVTLQLGRENSGSIEVLNGIDVGDIVLVSDYDKFEGSNTVIVK